MTKKDDIMTLQVNTDNFSDTVRMVLNGELNTITASQLEQQLNDALIPQTSTLIMDLEHLSFVSSAGLRIFAKAQKMMKARSGHAYFVRPSPQVKKVFDIVKIVKVSDVFSNDDELDDYLAAMQRDVVA